MNILINAKDIRALYSRVMQSNCPIKMPMEERWYRVGNEEVGFMQFLIIDPDGFLF